MNTKPPPEKMPNQDTLEAVIHMLRKMQATRYNDLAGEMAKLGEPQLQDIFQTLADDIDSGNRAHANFRRKAIEAYVPDAGSGLDGPGTSGLWSAYAVWAYAVRYELRLFDQLTSLNIPFDAEHMRSALAKEARSCLDRAARYRVNRRLAFHAERNANKTAQFPDVRRIDTLEDFAHVALAIERYFLSLARRCNALDGERNDVIRASERAIAKLEPMSQGGPPANRLRNALKRLNALSTDSDFLKGVAVGGIAKLALEADRIFDYYDRVFEDSLDPQVTRAAQESAADAIVRLRMLKQLQSAT